MRTLVLIAVIAISLGGAVTARADDGGPKPDELFKKLDVNGDGKLTAAEVPQEQQKYFERLLRLGDADKNGELTRDEFDRAVLHKESPVTDISRTGGLGGGPGGRGDFNPKRIFEMLDKNKDGKITRDEADERPRIKQMMERLGKDELTIEDLAGLGKGGGRPEGKGNKNKGRPRPQAAATLESARPEEQAQRADGAIGPAFLRLLDANHDGKLSKEEVSKASDVFEQLDRNKDGVLDRDELVAAPKAAGEGDEMLAAARLGRPRMRRAKGGTATAGPANGQGGHIAEMLKKADKDGDGKISKDEAPPRLKEHFSQLDKNGDGFLDKGEVEQAVKYMQQHKRAGKAKVGGKKAALTTPTTPTQE